MALKVKKIETSYGLTLENVYFRICMISYVDNAEVLKYKGVFYINEDMRSRDKLKYIDGLDFEGFMCVSDNTIKSSNLFELSYTHIKEHAKEVNKLLETVEEEEKIFLDTKYLIFLDAEDC